MSLFSRASQRASSLVRGVRSRGGELDYQKYWDNRYRQGGTSGAGSYGDSAEYKASVINRFVADHDVTDVVEFGCGDGNQLSHYELPKYLGLDVAQSAVDRCRSRFADDPTKSFQRIIPGEDLDLDQYDLALSIEVLMHVIDEDDFLWSLEQIFRHSRKYVVIQTPLTALRNFAKGYHERYRDLFPYLVPYVGEFAITEIITHPSVTPEGRRRGEIGEASSDFIIFERRVS